MKNAISIYIVKYFDKIKCYADRPYLVFSELKPETHTYIYLFICFIIYSMAIFNGKTTSSLYYNGPLIILYLAKETKTIAKIPDRWLVRPFFTSSFLFFGVHHFRVRALARACRIVNSHPLYVWYSTPKRTGPFAPATWADYFKIMQKLSVHPKFWSQNQNFLKIRTPLCKIP